MKWRQYRADILEFIGGTRAELDAMTWPDFIREWMEARRRVMARRRR